MSSFMAFCIIIKRECLLMLRKRNEFVNPLLFFLLVTMLFPLASSAEIKLLQQIGPGVIWIAALLSTLLTLNKIFNDDQQDGSLEQLMLSPYPLAIIVLAKIIAYWLLLSVPLVLISPLLGLMFGLSVQVIKFLFLSLAIGTLILNLVGAIVAALTVSLRGGGLLLALVLLPLYVPVLIFGSGVSFATEIGFPVSGQMTILVAMLLLALTLAPFVCAFALRIGIAFDS